MQKLEMEDLRFLTKCGRNLPTGQFYRGGRNRPALVMANDSIITMNQARLDYGFVSQVVYESACLIDASRVEDAIQTRFQYLPFGTHRLWRCVAMGRSSDQSDVEEKRVYKVFITYSTQVVDKLTQNILKIKGSKDKDQSDSGSEPLYSIYADFQRSGQNHPPDEAESEWMSETTQKRWIYHSGNRNRLNAEVTTIVLLAQADFENSLGKEMEFTPLY